MARENSLQASRRVALFQEASEGLLRLDAAGFAPFDELGHVEAAVGGFAVVDPRLGFLQPFAEFALGQTGLLSQRSEQAGQGLVAATMLGLGRHDDSFARQDLDTISVSTEDWRREADRRVRH